MVISRRERVASARLVVGMLLFACMCIGLAGYHFRTVLRIAVCLAIEADKSECQKIALMEGGEHMVLTSEMSIRGRSGLYSVTPPSGRWLRNGWGGAPAENVDLGILSETGAADLDFVVVPRGDGTAEELSRTGIQWAIDLGEGDLMTTRVEIENASSEAFVSRYCRKLEKGLVSCAYSLVIPIENRLITASGSCANVANLLAECEKILLSVQITRAGIPRPQP